MKSSKQKSGNLHPEVINASFQFSNLIKKYELIITSDTQIAFLLNYIDECLQNASLGDTQSLKRIIREGSGILDKINKLLKQDVIEEQTEDNESAAIVNDECRLSLNYLELRNELINFKNEYLNKIQAIKI